MKFFWFVILLLIIRLGGIALVIYLLCIVLSKFFSES